MKHLFITMKVWKDTHKAMRLLAAMKEQSIVQMLDDVVKAELERVRHEN